MNCTDRTLHAYEVCAEDAIASWSASRKPSLFLREFAALLKGRAVVLDYGCGIGTDLAWLANRGFTVQGIEAVAVFVEESRRRVPRAKIIRDRFETVSLSKSRFDGIWSHAALIHVPPKELVHQVGKLFKALKPGGVLGFTLSWGRRKTYTVRDWIPDRYIACYTKFEASQLLRGYPVRELKVFSNDGRLGRWIRVMIQKDG